MKNISLFLIMSKVRTLTVAELYPFTPAGDLVTQCNQIQKEQISQMQEDLCTVCATEDRSGTENPMLRAFLSQAGSYLQS